VEIVRADADRKKLTLQIDMDPELPAVVSADAGRLRQVLLNLVANAIKFTDVGTVSVRVRQHTPPDSLLFEVVDTGVGITEQDVPRLFQPFTQVDSSDRRRHGGTGLGLSISKGLIEAMGGAMGVRSQLGHGSTFWFSLPITVVHTPLPESPSKAPDSLLRLHHPAHSRVLVVEDNAINKRLAVRLLAKLGYNAEAVDDGQQAVDRVLNETFSLVLMDCQMPVLDGLEATREIRRREAGRRTPIVALTAGALDIEEANCFKAGMDGFIAKPIDLQKLTTILNTWHSSECTAGAEPCKVARC
jgi:CheY-like chemotaxis protein